MLVTFRSTATDSIRMFRETAEQLLRLMGASGSVPGALSATDVPAAIQQLEAGIQALKALPDSAEPQTTAALPADNEDDLAEDEEDREPPIALEVRAIPLIGLLKRAAAANAEVMWE
ncbi:MAG TPA: DUF1840 domain-containing protein [Povalibacter sp.]|jgi:hypothetical protein|nr:DUF1840 domain-containing protein [Povalibacter sp.]